jgi:hypothetical protein
MGVAAQRSDADGAVRLDSVVVEVGQVVDVDQELRGREAQLQQRDEALSPGEDLRLAAARLEQGDGLVE